MANQSAPKFKFVGGTRSGSKIRWPLEAQALIVKAHKIDGVAGAKAIEAGVSIFNAGVEDGSFTGPAITLPLPKSYTNKNAGSVLYGMEERFLNRCDKGDKDTLAFAEKYGLVEALVS